MASGGADQRIGNKTRPPNGVFCLPEWDGWTIIGHIKKFLLQSRVFFLTKWNYTQPGSSNVIETEGI